jgi:death-on-curing protein
MLAPSSDSPNDESRWGSPDFLTPEQVLELHFDQVNFFGGLDSLVDPGLFESAVIAPINYFHYCNTKNLFDLGACYAYHLVKNHPFVDGNKRTALAAALAFLNSNGIRIEVKDKVIFRAMMRLTTSRDGMLKFSATLREYSSLQSSFMAALFENRNGQSVRPKGRVFDFL